MKLRRRFAGHGVVASQGWSCHPGEPGDALLSRLPDWVELFGGGGWAAIPLAAGAGAGIALLLRAAATVAAWASARVGRPARRAAVARALPGTALPEPRRSVSRAASLR